MKNRYNGVPQNKELIENNSVTFAFKKTIRIKLYTTVSLDYRKCMAPLCLRKQTTYDVHTVMTNISVLHTVSG